MRTLFKPLVLATVTMALAACMATEDTSQSSAGSPAASATVTRDVSFRMNLAQALDAGVAVTRTDVRVFNDQLERTVQASIEDQSATVSFPDLPVGSYSIEVNVYDGSTLVASGSGNAQVSASSTTDVNLVLNPVTGNLAVAICMPDLATQYMAGNGGGAVTANADQQYFDDNTQPAFMRFRELFDQAQGDLSYSYRIGDVALNEEGGSQLPQALYTDHGASLAISDANGGLLTLGGCNSRVDVEVANGEVALVFAMPETYADQQMVGYGLTRVNIRFDGLAMVLRFSGNATEAIPADAQRLADIDFSKFTRQRLYLAAPVTSADMTSFEIFTASVMVNSVFNQLDLGLYWSVAE